MVDRARVQHQLLSLEGGGQFDVPGNPESPPPVGENLERHIGLNPFQSFRQIGALVGGRQMMIPPGSGRFPADGHVVDPLGLLQLLDELKTLLRFAADRNVDVGQRQSSLSPMAAAGRGAVRYDLEELFREVVVCRRGRRAEILGQVQQTMVGKVLEDLGGPLGHRGGGDFPKLQPVSLDLQGCMFRGAQALRFMRPVVDIDDLLDRRERTELLRPVPDPIEHILDGPEHARPFTSMPRPGQGPVRMDMDLARDTRNHLAAGAAENLEPDCFCPGTQEIVYDFLALGRMAVSESPAEYRVAVAAALPRGEGKGVDILGRVFYVAGAVAPLHVSIAMLPGERGERRFRAV